MIVRYYDKAGSDLPTSEERPLPVEQLSRAQHFTKRAAPLRSVQTITINAGIGLGLYSHALYDRNTNLGVLEFNTNARHEEALIPLWSGASLDQWRKAGRVVIDLSFVAIYPDLVWQDDAQGTIAQKIARVDSAMHLFSIFGIAYESGAIVHIPLHVFYNSGSPVFPFDGFVAQLVRETIVVPQPAFEPVLMMIPGLIPPHYVMGVTPISFGQAGPLRLTNMTVYSEVF